MSDPVFRLPSTLEPANIAIAMHAMITLMHWSNGVVSSRLVSEEDIELSLACTFPDPCVIDTDGILTRMVRGDTLELTWWLHASSPDTPMTPEIRARFER